MIPVQVRHLAREIKHLAPGLGSSEKLRSVRHRHFESHLMLIGHRPSVGDMHFQAIRRFWTRTTSAPTYAYFFTDPQPNSNPALGTFHTAELPYLFGNLSTSGPPKVANFTRAMMDYWISFAVTLNPNDGKGTSSTSRRALIPL
jgi:carboxylesterase type B